MSEILPTKAISITDTKVEISVNTAANLTRPSVAKEMPQENEQLARAAQTDVFNASSKAAALNQSVNKQPVFDITDKLAAIYGEKEKDIKEKLSDSFKRMILRPFDALSQVDASMNHLEHYKEKKLKDREPEVRNNESLFAKIHFSLKHWINYKLLEIAGEIINFSRRVKSVLVHGHKKLRLRFFKNFKKFKSDVIFLLDTIEAYSQPADILVKHKAKPPEQKEKKEQENIFKI